jgi:hypothetical protein
VLPKRVFRRALPFSHDLECLATGATAAFRIRIVAKDGLLENVFDLFG